MSYILTTHVGSLPRGNELVPLLLARDHEGLGLPLRQGADIAAARL